MFNNIFRCAFFPIVYCCVVVHRFERFLVRTSRVGEVWRGGAARAAQPRGNPPSRTPTYGRPRHLAANRKTRDELTWSCP